MDIFRLINVLIRKLRYLLTIPLIAGFLMFLASKNQPSLYESKASIFTAITSSPSIDNLGNNRVDFFATKTAYNNLLSILSSRNVIEETSLRLFAMHIMLERANPVKISENSFNELQKIVPPEVRKMVVKDDPEETYENLLTFMNQDKNNFVYGLLNYDHPHYSYKAISSNVKIQQVGASDIVELSYELNDPGVVFQTLNILIEVFLGEYRVLKKSQTNAVVEYFEEQLQKSSSQLSVVEDNLLAFNKANNIVNYYEQTKHISSQQEKIEVKLQDIILDYQSAEAVLKKLEVETQARFKVNINTKDILEIRRSLTVLNQKLARIEIEKDDPSQITPAEVTLKKEQVELQTELQQKIDSLHVYGRNSEGMNIDVLLNNWLKIVIEYEGARARLQAMQKKNNEFSRLYAQYAPLGAELKRIEREIDVREKEYLEILHQLGLAKLKQQNEEMMAKMKILDHPLLPINSKPTKRKLYIAVIVVFTFIFLVIGFVVFELLDKTIKFPKRMEELSQTTVAGACTTEKKRDPKTALVNKTGLKSISEDIISKANNSDGKPIVIQFLSHWKDEGKTFITQTLKSQLSMMGYLISILDLQNDIFPDNKENNILTKQLHQAKSYLDLLRLNNKASNPDIVFIELPPASDQMLNIGLLNTADMSYLIADARRSWEQSDDFMLKNKRAQIKGKLECILNFLPSHEMISIVGKSSQTKWYKRFQRKNYA